MVSIRQVKAARAMLGWSQHELSEKSGISYPTVARLETCDGDIGGRADTAEKIVSALVEAGIIFVDADGHEGPGVRLRKQTHANHPEPQGPATDVVRAMDEAIKKHRAARKK